MDNQDKIFNQIKEASRNSEAQEFPAMDKVWSRVETKLDQKVLTKQNKLWKKIAIAASILLVFTLGYQILKSDTKIETQQKQVVVVDSVKIPTSRGNAVAIRENNNSDRPEKTNPMIRQDANKILKQQVESAAVVVLDDKENAASDNPVVVPAPNVQIESGSDGTATTKSARFLKGRRSDAIGVQRNEMEMPAFEADRKKEQAAKKDDPLWIVDGKPVIVNKDKSVKEGSPKIDPETIEEMVVLKEPLYIINGHYYSEAELFGPNPTSPYAPLNQQEIETLSVLQGEKAIANFGKRGEKGVVIISTKNGKPVAKPALKKSN